MGGRRIKYCSLMIMVNCPRDVRWCNDVVLLVDPISIAMHYIFENFRFRPSLSCGGSDGHDGSEPNQHQQHQQYLGDASAAIPNFESIETDLGTLPPGVHLDHLHTFELLYKEHCEVCTIFLLCVFAVTYLPLSSLMLPNCFGLFSIHLKLELLTQFPAPNVEK